MLGHKLNKRALKKVLFLIPMTIIFMVFFSITAHAQVTDEQAIDILKTYPLEKISNFSYICRLCGWGLAKGLCTLIDQIYTAIFQISDLIRNMINSNILQSITNNEHFSLQIIIFTCFALVIAVIGIQFMIRGSIKHEIVQNLVIGIIILVGIPFVLPKAVDMTTAAMDAMNNGGSISGQVLSESITDNMIYDSENFVNKDIKGRNNISNISTVNPVEVIYDKNTENKNVWGNIINTKPDGEEFLEKIPAIGILGNEVDILGARYYRYDIDFLTILITSIVTIIALVFTLIKIARLLFELLVHQVLANFLALLDIQSGQRLKKCLQSIIATFATMFGCMFMFQLYILGNNYMRNYCFPSGGDKKVFLYLICLIAFAWMLIDGPNIIEHIVGVDVGLRDPMRTMYLFKLAKDKIDKKMENDKQSKMEMQSSINNSSSSSGSNNGNHRVSECNKSSTVGQSDKNNKANYAMPGMSNPHNSTKGASMNGKEENSSQGKSPTESNGKSNLNKSIPGMAKLNNSTQGTMMSSKAGNPLSQGKSPTESNSKSNLNKSIPGMAKFNNSTQGTMMNGKAGNSYSQGKSSPGMNNKSLSDNLGSDISKPENISQGSSSGKDNNNISSPNSGSVSFGNLNDFGELADFDNMGGSSNLSNFSELTDFNNMGSFNNSLSTKKQPNRYTIGTSPPKNKYSLGKRNISDKDNRR